MITYHSCDQVPFSKVHEAFTEGFIDYIVQIQMDEARFYRHFIEIEGNQLENSFIALDDDTPVGVMLGGIKVYEGTKTLRCGALAVKPAYRGKQVSQKLFALHRDLALKEGCQQLFLEVIQGNDRAINFYRRQGYGVVYDLTYFSHRDPQAIKVLGEESLPFEIRKEDLAALEQFREQRQSFHINWQNDWDYLAQMGEVVHYYVAYQEKQPLGAIAINQSGKIHFLWVNFPHRRQGVARGLLARAVEELNPEKLLINFPNNHYLEAMVHGLGFQRDALSQHEMFYYLERPNVNDLKG